MGSLMILLTACPGESEANRSERARYQIVGEDEADVKLGKISYTSPVARAMMGKEEGDEIVVKAPSGDIRYEIDKVEYL